MKKLFLGIIICLFVMITNAQESDMDMEAMQKVWQEFMTPGDMHKMLAKSEGKWNTNTKFWQYPGADPQPSKGEAEFKMILGGRYLESTHTGEAMGMQFTGKTIEGYDNAKEEFFSIWIDDMGTGIAMATGKWDEAKNAFIYHGTMTDPLSGGDQKFKNIVTVKSDDKVVFDMYGNAPDGTEFLMMKMVYIRVK